MISVGRIDEAVMVVHKEVLIAFGIAMAMAVKKKIKDLKVNGAKAGF